MTKTLTEVFDYSKLPEDDASKLKCLAGEFNREKPKIAERLAAQAEAVYEANKLFSQKKTGMFGAWVRAELRIARSWAADLRSAWEECGRQKEVFVRQCTNEGVKKIAHKKRTKRKKSVKQKCEQCVCKKCGSKWTWRAAKFEKPLISEVASYVREKGYTFDPDYFWHFHESKGWIVGNVPMSNWKSACYTFEQNQAKFGNGKPDDEYNQPDISVGRHPEPEPRI